MGFSTTEITSAQITSDNPVHQRLFFAYAEASKRVAGNLLEIGCGVGRGLAVLSEHCDRYTAIDKNKALLDALGQQYPALHFIHQHIPPLANLPDDSFDYVVSFQVIEHIDDDDLFVKEIHRVLKPGGKAILTTPNIQLSLTRNPWHVREYTADGLEKLLRKYFDQVQKQGVHGNAKVMTYHEQNRKSVERITRFDVLNLQYRLPRTWLQVPYDILNRLNRRSLQQQNTGLVSEISYEDYFLSPDADTCLDFFYTATK